MRRTNAVLAKADAIGEQLPREETHLAWMLDDAEELVGREAASYLAMDLHAERRRLAAAYTDGSEEPDVYTSILLAEL